MPGQVIRVYPASGGVAMLPLTPENDYTPTIIFCGGSTMNEFQWGNFSFPFANTWEIPASKDCQTITPEPADKSAPRYVQDDDMPEGRSMGQFIILPDGKLLMVNGAMNGTAGYSQATMFVHSYSEMPFGESLASGPALTPAIYDPKAPKGKRWSKAGLKPSKIPRMYHSSAMLLPDASVFIAGSNPNVDVNLTTVFPTTYEAEIFYPPYFELQRPEPKGFPSTLSYGGAYFNITIPASSYSGSANAAAESAIVSVLRGGFTTHAMNMGQRFLQLKNTFTVQQDGTIILHVSQMPPKPEVFQPGPAFVYVVINGAPSTGHYVIVGSGKIETQPKLPEATLPPSVRVDSAKGSGSGKSNNAGGDSASSSGMSMTTIIAIAAGGLVVLGLIFGIWFMRRRKAAARKTTTTALPMATTGGMGAGGVAATTYGNDSSAFVPLKQGQSGWNDSSASLVAPYKDNAYGPQDQSSSYSRPSYDPNGRRY